MNDLSEKLTDANPLTTFQKVWLTVISLLCYGIWYTLHTRMGLPVYPGFSAGFLGDKPFIGSLLVLVGIPVVTCLASLVTGRIRFEAGLFCCTVGLISLSVHGGDVRQALLDNGPVVYIRFALESVILGTSLVAAYLILQKRLPLGIAWRATEPDSPDPDTPSDRITVVVVQALVMMCLMTILCPSPQKGQALGMVGLSGALASMIVHHVYKVRSSFWYLCGTMLASIVAYLYTGLFSPGGASIGVTTGWVAGAARALPLDYASLGVAGTVFGYWTSRVWQESKTMSLPSAASTT
ncbi:MAG: hypothetical protein KatS3mg104_1435 [Phycisphaerae bacterium]|jgi:hypothetical protein|nr:MAG: hypothetical protein KatS3mg104_1435 [Phycisphaerae bacterium]